MAGVHAGQLSGGRDEAGRVRWQVERLKAMAGHGGSDIERWQVATTRGLGRWQEGGNQSQRWQAGRNDNPRETL